jgi:hypothetical protein
VATLRIGIAARHSGCAAAMLRSGHTLFVVEPFILHRHFRRRAMRQPDVAFA